MVEVIVTINGKVCDWLPMISTTSKEMCLKGRTAIAIIQFQYLS
jgi:hypothetical protein